MSNHFGRFRALTAFALLWGSMGLGAFGSEAFAFNIKCVKDDGTISGGTPENSCKNLLPKCSDVHNDYKLKTFESLSWKIYGYFKGWDLNTNQTTAASPSGNQMPFKICSVVGKQIKFKGDADLAFKYRDYDFTPANGGLSNYSGDPCGEMPAAKVDPDTRDVYLRFEGSYGNAVTAMMYGALPYEIRAEAYKFFQQVTKPADLDAKLDAPELQPLKAQIDQIQSMSDEYFSSLPPEAKAACTDPQSANLLARCKGQGEPFSLSDPSLRLCTLAQASMMVNQGSVASLIQAQIVKKALESFDTHFGNYLNPNSSPLWSTLVDNAAAETDWWDCVLTLRGKRQCAAFVLSGVLGDGRMKVYRSYDGYATSDSPQPWNRVGEAYIGYDLTAPPGLVIARRAFLPNRSSPYLRFSGFPMPAPRQITLGSGFAAGIEYITRKIICGQSAVNQDSPQCDETAIPNVPPLPQGVALLW